MPCFFLFLWVGGLMVQAAFEIHCFRRQARISKFNSVPLVLSSIGSIAPLISLIVFVWVFVVGRSSNVAQVAAGSDQNLWSFWFHSWPALLLANGCGVMIHLFALGLPPYPWEDGESYFGRCCGLIATGSALATVYWLMPDA